MNNPAHRVAGFGQCPLLEVPLAPRNQLGELTNGLLRRNLVVLATLARQAGVKIAITTDAHSTHELGNMQNRLEQARRAGLPATEI